MTRAPHGALAQDLQKARVCLVLGSGGVGKTTTSVAIAMLAAQMGRRVGLLSIDPAKRLADALGIKLGHDLVAVKLPGVTQGSLHATMLDQKAVFDAMVRKFAPSKKIEQLILKNSVYQAAAQKMGGPLEYMAIAKLQQMHEDERFDFIVVDTPPDVHALDFLVRPNVLRGFMDHKVMGWLIKPFLIANKLGRGKFIGVTEKLMGGLASVTGLPMLKKLAEFLVLIEDILQGFHHSSERVAALLKQSSTHFVLVTAPTGASARSVQFIAQRLKHDRFHVGSLIVNRFMPDAVVKAIHHVEREHVSLDEWDSTVKMLAASVQTSYSLIANVWQELHRLFPEMTTVQLDEQLGPLHTLPAMLQIAQQLGQSVSVTYP